MNNQPEKYENSTYRNNREINGSYMMRNSSNDSESYLTVRQFNNEYLNGLKNSKSQKFLHIENLNHIGKSSNTTRRVENVISNNTLSSLALNTLTKTGIKLISNESTDNISNTPPIYQYGIPNNNREAKAIETHLSDTTSTSKKELKKSLPKRYFCHVCNKGFSRKHNMVSHILVHSEDKPHECSICNTKFRRTADLKRHEKLHVGAKPYACERCNRCFARIDALTRHKNSRNACSANKFQKSITFPNSHSTVENNGYSNITSNNTNKNNSPFSSGNHMNSPTRMFPDIGSLDNPTTGQEFVPFSKYRDLVSYTHELQKNLSKMNSRILLLEKINGATGKADEVTNMQRMVNDSKHLDQFPRMENSTEHQLYNSSYSNRENGLGNSNMVNHQDDTNNN